MPKVRLGRAEMSYDTAGDEGSPVLLIMGFGVPGHLWGNQVPALSASHRVAWFDNCGAGGTRAGRAPVSLRAQAEHAAGLIEHLGHGPAHIVGVSMGGMIAQELALAFPERVRSLSLLVTHAGGLRNVLPNPRGLNLFVRGFLGPRRGRAYAMEQLIFPAEYLETIDRGWLLQTLKDEVVEAMPRRARLAQIAGIVRHHTAPRLPRLAGLPTLVVAAGQDALIRPEEHVRLHQLIPGSRLEYFADSGHGILHQCAERLNAALLAHFAEVDARPERDSRPHLVRTAIRR
ncbi:MAG: alpha/beta hydrolase [Deltaproteobacteria bacterium]|nr:alpha/beta hydrolase [Deltaproteobacteria bacterium]